MICAACGTATAAAPCTTCAADPLLDARYRLDEVLGQGGAGVTYRATRLADGAVVCVKELAYHRLQSFEAERLFRREAAVLRQLRHPQIPAYVDDFAAGHGKQLALYLVQDLVVGQSLTDELRDRRLTEREILELLAELLDILAYLHGLAPPVVHRDLKPSNILRRAADQRLVLVDFGAVKDTLSHTISGGPTVAGTFGYMAPEQLYGQASPASDLYAVGVLAIVMLSRRDPTELVDAEQRLNWREHVRVAPATADLLDRLTRRNPTERPEDAAAARALVTRALATLDRPAPAARPAPAGLLAESAAPPAWTPKGRPAPTDDDGRASPPSWSAASGTYEEEPSGHGFRNVVLISASLLVGAFMLAFIARPGAVERPEPQPSPITAEAPCGDHPCAALSEPFLDGLRFGMTTDEARAARREFQNATPQRVGGPLGAEVGVEVPGLRGDENIAREELEARVLVADEPTTCTLDFVDGEGLVRIDCEAQLPDSAAARTMADRLYSAVHDRYGEPIPQEQFYGIRFDPRWEDHDGSLVVHSALSDRAEVRSTVGFQQESSRWEAARAEARRQYEARRADAELKRTETLRAEREAEKARLKALESGTTPTPP